MLFKMTLSSQNIEPYNQLTLLKVFDRDFACSHFSGEKLCELTATLKINERWII